MFSYNGELLHHEHCEPPKLKVLELFCGLGGWSKPWIEQGHEVTGIDFKDFSKQYPGRFIQADLMDWEPDQHYDIILASPPCNEFSIIKQTRLGNQNEMKGLDLVYRTYYLINKIKPKYHVIENVKGLSGFIGQPRERIKYNTHKDGKTAYLWGDFPTIGLLPNQFEYRAFDTKKPRTREQVAKSNGGGRVIGSKKPQLKATCKTSAERALIPYPLAKAVYDLLETSQ